jgi:membrane protease YdiL (CAAX protease family)
MTITTNTAAAWIALLAYLAFAYPPWRGVLGRFTRRLGDWTVELFLLPYLLAVNLHPVPGDLLRFIVYLALPTLCLRLRPRAASPFDVWQVLAILFIGVPIEADLFFLLLDLAVPGAHLAGRFSGFLSLPRIEASLWPGVTLPIHTLTAVLLALFLFLVYQPLEGIGFTFRLRWRDVRDALLGLLAFAIVGLPVGLGLGFVRFDPAAPGPLEVVRAVVGGYLLVALPEETLFRGVIQNLLTRRLGRAWLALPIASLIFGLAHLNNATRGFPVPNWAYVLMAALAGLAYGWVWRRTRKVTASALTHMLANLLWGIVFR